MTPPSPGKHRGPIVRQLSLQNPTAVQFPGARGLKKQLSEDDGRFLESVEVTGQGWNGGGNQLRLGSGSGKIGQTKITATRPKPLKFAWADRKPENLETSAGVEVIATKCQGQPRPTSLKTQRLRSPLLGNKDTLVYTRLQLAERLRNAWSEREKIKPNINIFLTRPPDTSRSENNEQTTDGPPDVSASFRDAVSTLSDPSAPLDKKRKSMRIRAFSQEFSRPDDFDLKNQDFDVAGPAPTSDASESDSRGIGKSSPRTEEEFPGSRVQELSKIEIRVTKIDKETEDRENKPPQANPEEPSAGVKRSRNKVSESFPSEKTEMEGKETVKPSAPTAQDRRANFRRNSILHKTITESFSSGFKEIEKKPPQKKPPLTRAFSAPCQNDQSDVYKAANQQKKVKTTLQKRLQPTVSFDIPSTGNDDAALLRERMKSAPVRRRLRSAAARRKSKDKDSSDEDKEAKDAGPAAGKKTSKRSQLKKGADIVTMVSLVSPAASDTEDSVINLPIESWRAEEKEEPLQSGKTSGVEESKNSSLVLQKFVSLRKTTKSVTFHPHPILNRSYSASFPSRRAPAGTPVIVPTPIVSNPALTPAQLFERDRRAAVAFSALDGRGIKRKFFRSSTESIKDDEILDSDGKGEEDVDGVSKSIEKSKESNDEGDTKTSGEPDFKCQKEKECWNLYQKMVEKGVSVSFDTVLRGMLTPTEYRLRKNYLSNF